MSWVNKIIKAVYSLVSVPILIEALGKAGYGLLALTGMVLSLGMMLDMGLGASLVRHMASAHGEKDSRGFNAMFNSSTIVYLFIWLVLLVFFVGFPYHICRWFDIPPEWQTEAVHMLRFFSPLQSLLIIASSMQSTILTSLNKIHRNMLRNVTKNLLLLVGILIGVAWLGYGIYFWMGLTVSATAIIFFIQFLDVRRYAKELKFSPVKIEMEALKVLYKTGGVLLVARVVRKIKFDVDPLLISSFVGIASLTIYNPVFSIITNIRPIISSFTNNLLPITSRLQGNEQEEQLHKVFLKSTRITSMMGILMLSGFIVLGDVFLDLWIGKQLGEDIRIAYQLLIAWSIVEFAHNVEGSSWPVLFGLNKMHHMIWTDAFIGVLNVGASYFLIAHTSLGIVAVVIPSVVLESLMKPYYLFHTATTIRFPKTQLLRQHIYPLLGLIVLVMAPLLALKYWVWKPEGLLGFFLSALFLSIYWASMVYWVGLNKSEKHTIKLKLNQFRQDLI